MPVTAPTGLRRRFRFERLGVAVAEWDGQRPLAEVIEEVRARRFARFTSAAVAASCQRPGSPPILWRPRAAGPAPRPAGRSPVPPRAAGPVPPRPVHRCGAVHPGPGIRTRDAAGHVPAGSVIGCAAGLITVTELLLWSKRLPRPAQADRAVPAGQLLTLATLAVAGAVLTVAVLGAASLRLPGALEAAAVALLALSRLLLRNSTGRGR